MKRGSGPRNVNLIHGAEALDVVNQPAKFARRFSLSLDHLPWITRQGGLFPQRPRPPDAAPQGPAAAGLAIILTPRGNDEGELVRECRLIDEPERQTRELALDIPLLCVVAMMDRGNWPTRRNDSIAPPFAPKRLCPLGHE
jgi:hypothetical protein